MFQRRIPEHKLRLPSADEALPGRSSAISTSRTHCVLGTPLQPPYPAGMQQIVLGMGCFWGVERLFWKIPGVYTTAVGYTGGLTPNPTYEEVCSGMTGHNEMGTQYRSGIYVSDPAQQMAAEVSKARFADLLLQAGKDPVTTEIRQAPTFYYAEDYHQQYLHKNPGGYCNLAGTGICLPPN